MTRRSGITLIEVLVAIFIMAIGLIALLTLFPIGMLRMAQAIRDARSSECGYNAHTISIMQDIRNDAAVITDGVSPDLFFNNGGPGLPNADPYGESYSVLVDPIGYYASAAGGQDWVGGPGVAGYLRRRYVQFTGAAPVNIYRNFSLWDDINFDPTNAPGTPQTVGAAILRDTRFSWAYLLRRPQTSDRSIVDCSVVVFDRRSMSLSNNLQLEEYVYANASYFDPTKGTIAIDYTLNVPPPVQTGDWIFDATLNNAAVTTPCAAHAYFYRVVATEEFVVNGRTVARYEVQNPIRGFQNPNVVPMNDPTFGGAFGYQGTAIVIRGIVEVFEKGPVRLP